MFGRSSSLNPSGGFLRTTVLLLVIALVTFGHLRVPEIRLEGPFNVTVLTTVLGVRGN